MLFWVDADALTFEGGIVPRFVALDTLIEQETKYTAILVQKIAALNPTIVFVSKQVSRKAQVR
jgi:hypothetical protein